MNSLMDDREERYSREDAGGDREISLGTATILGIFFALTLVCAGFFGLGYTMGRKSGPVPVGGVAETTGAGGSGAAKPSAGSAKDPYAVPTVAAGHDAASLPAVQAPVRSVAAPVPVRAPAEDAVEPPKSGSQGPAAVAPAAALPPIPATSPGGIFLVQVAAVSSQEIADIELSALKKKGYDVAVRHEAQDKLLHVQIGPFATRKDAEAMRVRVLNDGFNAIVK